MPRRWLSRRWAFHTKGSFRVDVQRLRSPQQAADYLVGYTVGQRKKAQQAHLAQWPGPRVRYSRGYFPCRVREIRELLFGSPVREPGMWEWVGTADRWWWFRPRLAAAVAREVAAAAETGTAPSKPRQEPPESRAYYEKKLGEGKKKKAALTCLMRVLVRVVWRMLKRRQPYTKVTSSGAA